MEKRLVLYGAGKTGEKFVGDNLMKEMTSRYKGVVFYDGNDDLPQIIMGINRISEISEHDDVLITSRLWEEIVRICVIKGANVIGIYEPDERKIYDYREMCISKKAGYENPEMMRFNNEKNERIKNNIDRFKKSGKIYGNFGEVAIMISNLCNYAMIHPQCPASMVKAKEIMPAKMVYKIIDELAASNYEGDICFHIYNEPTIDPRLFLFIQYAKEKIEKCIVRVYSNGYYLDQNLIEEFCDIGMGALNTTGYGQAEFERLIHLEVPVPYSVIYGHLDERLDWYDDSSINSSSRKRECYTFLNQICIYSNGDIGLCCLDYKHSYNLGNVYKNTLQEILDSENVIIFQKELMEGKRTRYTLCRNCGWIR